MPLTVELEDNIIQAEINAKIVSPKAEISLQRMTTLKAEVDSQFGVRVPQYVNDHILDRDNPHEVTYDQTGAVPFRLSVLPQVEKEVAETPSFRLTTSVFVGNEDGGYRMSLQDFKDMNTKIVSAKSLDEVDLSKLSDGDYIYIEQ